MADVIRVLQMPRLLSYRDGAGIFEPQLVKKHQTQLTYELERSIDYAPDRILTVIDST